MLVHALVERFMGMEGDTVLVPEWQSAMGSFPNGKTCLGHFVGTKTNGRSVFPTRRQDVIRYLTEVFQTVRRGRLEKVSRECLERFLMSEVPL